MDALLLGGMSKRSNSKWIYEVERWVNPYFKKVVVIHYDHWNFNEEKPIDFSLELEKTVKSVALLDKPYFIIAKSICSSLALQALSLRLMNPTGLFICGLPYSKEANDDYFIRLLEKNKLPTIILQNVDERYIRPQELITLLRPFKNYHVVEGKGSEHSYQAEVIADVVKNFIKILTKSTSSQP